MNIRRILAVLLTLIMVVSLTVTASAAETYTITVKKDDSSRVYKAYQIFTGDISSAEMTHIEWGNGVTAAGQTALQTEYGVASAQKLAGKLSNSDDAKVFAEKLVPYLQNGSRLLPR